MDDDQDEIESDLSMSDDGTTATFTIKRKDGKPVTLGDCCLELEQFLLDFTRATNQLEDAGDVKH